MKIESAACTGRHRLPKVVLLGDFGTGKSALFRRLTRGGLDAGASGDGDDGRSCHRHECQTTAPMAAAAATGETGVGSAAIRLPDGTKAMLYDTCGLERYGRSLTHSYYRGAVCIVLVADATNLRSVRDLDDWNTEAQCYAPDAAKVLVFSKSDSPVADTGLIGDGEIESYRRRLDCFRSAIVSAKTGRGIDLLLQRIAEANQLHRRREVETLSDLLVRSKFIQLQEKSEEKSSELLDLLNCNCA